MTASNTPLRKRALLQRIGLALAAAALPACAFAQAYPSRPIKLIVPAPPGGSTDVMARALAKALSEQNNVPVVVDNRAGAAGVIGIKAAIASPPDGYTIVLSAADATLIYPALKKVPPYDISKALTPLAQVAYTSFLFVVPSNSPFGTLKEVIDASRAKELPYGSNGFGSGNHMWMEAFKARTGANLLHVPYKGAAPAVQGLIAGETQFMITSPASGKAMLEAGRMKPLATSNPTRLPAFPNVPTLNESGYPGFVMGAWFGVFGPAGMPRPIVDKLHTMVIAAMASPEFQKQAETFMFDTRPTTRAAFEKVIADDAALLKAAIEAAKIPLED